MSGEQNATYTYRISSYQNGVAVDVKAEVNQHTAEVIAAATGASVALLLQGVASMPDNPPH